MLVAIGLVLALAFLPTFLSTESQPLSELTHWTTASAQRIRIDEIWQQVYQQLPDLPLENQYINDETGKVSPNNTLINRFIRYHVYVKSRPVVYRLDWKLTLADYLGVNEKMDPETYPSATALRTNPMQNDIAAIGSLNRAQRDALVNTLVSLFTPNPPTPAASPSPTVSPTPQPTPTPTPVIPRFPREPGPGDAQLLQP